MNAEEIEWSYEGDTGPNCWGRLNSCFALCDSGCEQSPVDVRNAIHAPLPALAIDYEPAPLVIRHIFRTVQVDCIPGSTLTLGDDRYELQQFHFHAPAEHTVRGKPFAMEAHLVHADAAGETAVIGVLLDLGGAHPILDAIWRHMPAQERTITVPGVRVSAADFLPRDLTYYTYDGSLTRPPCTEGVRWLLLRERRTLSAEQLAAYQRVFPPNARPVQPLNGRTILTNG